MKNTLTILGLLFAIVLSLASTGCESRDKTQEIPPQPTRPPVTVEPQVPFRAPISPAVYELPSGAIATWRQFSGNRPPLLLFSAHPFLEPLDEKSIEEVRQLIASGSDDEIIRRGQLFVPDPAFFPLQTLSAALDSSLFSELIMVLPLRGTIEETPFEKIKEQAVSSGFLSEAESKAMSMQNGVITGSVRGVPLRLVHPDALPEIATPLILHIDLGYFKNLYISEIKTPAYDLLLQTATSIRDHYYNTIAVTLSYSNQEIGLSLDSRFIIRYLADILADPALLDEQPQSWRLLAEVRYLSNMYMESKAREMLIQNAEIGTEDPAYLFALATSQFQERQAKAAFATLDRAVALDPGYGLEYLNLAQRGDVLGLKDKASELFSKAAKVFPSDPFIRQQMAEYLIRTGRGQEAKDILKELEALPWSKRVHGDIPARLRELETLADTPPEIETPKLPAHPSQPRSTEKFH